MCEQCVVDALASKDQVIPGYYLIQARRDGNLMKKGQWGLVHCNDPDVVWSARPDIDPSIGQEENADPIPGEITWIDSMASAEEEVENSCAYIMNGWRLIESCRKAGYDPDKNGCRFFAWLFHRLGEYVRENPPIHHGGIPLPHHDALFQNQIEDELKLGTTWI